MKIARSMLLSLGVAVAAMAPAAAQNFPDGKIIRIIVPFAAGGAQDVIARHVGNRLAMRLNASVIIENKGGAGGLIGADSVAKAEPDGTTLLMATGGAITIAPNRPQKLAYNPKTDFAPVALLADTPMTIAVSAQSPFKTLPNLIAAAKASPGTVTFASTGAGTVSNLTGELLAQQLGIKLVHVPYRGAGPGIQDLLGGQVQSMVTSTASIESHVASGAARVLASFTTAPLTNLGGAPTAAAAAGLKGLEVPVWVGVLAPAKTPAPVLAKLATEMQAICEEDDTKQRFAKLGALATCGTPAMLGKVIEEDMLRWKDVIAKGNIVLE